MSTTHITETRTLHITGGFIAELIESYIRKVTKCPEGAIVTVDVGGGATASVKLTETDSVNPKWVTIAHTYFN